MKLKKVVQRCVEKIATAMFAEILSFFQKLICRITNINAELVVTLSLPILAAIA
jgi:hypothetical protein